MARYLPYATPQTMNSLSQASDFTFKRFEIMLKAVAASEANLWQVYGAIAQFAQTVGVPGSLLAEFNLAAGDLNPIIATLAQIYTNVGGQTQKSVTYLPSFSTTSSGDVKGLGAGGIDVTRVYTAAEISTTPFEPPSQSLGAAEFVVPAWVILVGGSALIITSVLAYEMYARHEIDLAAIEATTARAQLRADEAVTGTAYALKITDACINKGTDPLICADTANKLWLQMQARLPDPTKAPQTPYDPTKSSGLGFFGWVGVAAFFSGLGIVGWYLFKKRQAKKNVPRPSRHAFDIMPDDELPEGI